MKDRKIHFSFTRKQQEFNPTRFLFASFREGKCSVPSWYVRENKPRPWSKDKRQSTCCMLHVACCTGSGGTRGCSVQQQGGSCSRPPTLVSAKTLPQRQGWACPAGSTHSVRSRVTWNPFFVCMVPLCYSLKVTYQKSWHSVVISTFDFLGAHSWRKLAVSFPIKVGSSFLIEDCCEFKLFLTLLKQICKLKSVPGIVNLDAKHPFPHDFFPPFPSSGYGFRNGPCVLLLILALPFSTILPYWQMVQSDGACWSCFYYIHLLPLCFFCKIYYMLCVSVLCLHVYVCVPHVCIAKGG